MVVAATLAFFVARATTPHRRAATPHKRAALPYRFSPIPPVTLAHPLPPFAKRISLQEISVNLGSTVTLPDSSLVKPSDAGSAWAASLRDPDTGQTDTTVAVTFPSQSLIVDYSRPVPYPDALANYQGYARAHPDAADVIDLNSVPALAIKQNSDDLGSNFGSIEFVAAGTQIVVLGHYDGSTLRAVAASVLSRAGA